MARASNRVGFGSNRGSANPKITVSTIPPSNPKHNDLWLDINTSPGIWKWWDAVGATWTE
jgi:hypothetical protein